LAVLSKGAIFFPIDMEYLAYDFINTDNRSINRYDTERMLRLIGGVLTKGIAGLCQSISTGLQANTTTIATAPQTC